MYGFIVFGISKMVALMMYLEPEALIPYTVRRLIPAERKDGIIDKFRIARGSCAIEGLEATSITVRRGSLTGIVNSRRCYEGNSCYIFTCNII